MEIIPAIDLRDGRCVRLYQGDFSKETVFSDDPLTVALGWQAQGAASLHLVDLDGAKQGAPANLSVIHSIVEALEIPVQVGGGIRNRSSAELFLSAGVERVVIGTAAVENPELVSNLCSEVGGDRILVAVDARDGLVTTRGWTAGSQVTAMDLALQMKALGVFRLLYTDVSRDGTMTSPNFEANAQLVSVSQMKVQASGGVSTLSHIRELVKTGAEGAIIGTALYQGTITLQDAIAAGKPQ